MVVPPGLEPGTLRVLSARDNHYTTEPSHKKEWEIPNIYTLKQYNWICGVIIKELSHKTFHVLISSSNTFLQDSWTYANSVTKERFRNWAQEPSAEEISSVCES